MMQVMGTHTLTVTCEYPGQSKMTHLRNNCVNQKVGYFLFFQIIPIHGTFHYIKCPVPIIDWLIHGVGLKEFWAPCIKAWLLNAKPGFKQTASHGIRGSYSYWLKKGGLRLWQTDGQTNCQTDERK